MLRDDHGRSMRTPHVAMRMAAFLAVMVGGCDERSTERHRPSNPPTTATSVQRPASYTVVDEGTTGTISGVVRWSGDTPAAVDVESSGPCGPTQSVSSLQVGSGGGVANAVIVLEGVREGRLPLGGEARIAFEGCQLSPRVVAVSATTALTFENREELLHNLRIVGRRESWLDVGLPHRGDTAEAVAQSGIYRITDDAAHPWIEGFLYVTDHPYVVVTGADGRFALPRVPVGLYQLRLWHPGLIVEGSASSGRPRRAAPIVLTRPIVVSESRDTAIDFQLDASLVEAAGSSSP